MSLQGANRPRGDITTLLDLTDRDAEENALFPLNTDTTWFTRDSARRILPVTPTLQEIPFRGPAAFGQRFTFDVGALQAGDMLHGTALQIRLGHWLDPTTVAALAGGRKTYDLSQSEWWQYANNLGAAIISSAELEIDGVTIETLDGDFCYIFTSTFGDLNQQFGPSTNGSGLRPPARLVSQTTQSPYPFPTEDGVLQCVLPFFFMRVRQVEALPLVAIREGTVRIHVTLRPFEEVVRQVKGRRTSCDATPLGQSFPLVSTAYQPPAPIRIMPDFPSGVLLTPTTVLSITPSAYEGWGCRFASTARITGPCEISFTTDSYQLFVGLTKDPTASPVGGRPQYEGAFFINSDYIPYLKIEGGFYSILNQIPRGWQPNDRFRIVYNGEEIVYFVNNNIIFTQTYTTSDPLYMCGTMLTNFGTPQVICSDIVFRPILNGRVTPESLPPTQTVVAVADPPPLETVSLLTWGTVTTGVFREAALRQPYEFLYRELQTFLFTEPLKYQVIKNSSSDIVSVQLPLEANHPIEEIFWVVRRRAVADNNEWYNFGSRLERDIIWSAASLPDISGAGLVAQKPLLVTARLQANGQTLVEADERYFRLEAGSKHRGGYVPYNRFIYGYSFARQPGEHQPSGTANASRLNSLRLTLDVATPTVFGAPAAHSSQDTTWEVRVYVLALNWLRVQNGLVSRVYTD